MSIDTVIYNVKEYIIENRICNGGNMKKNAFTLAEVLITLGIIGVVAAMTLPALIQKQQEKEIVTGLKKFYTLMSEAYTRAVDDNGPIEFWAIAGTIDGNDSEEGYTESANKYTDIFTRYLNVIKRCKANESTCYANVVYKCLNGSTYIDYSKPARVDTVVLADGMTFSMEAFSKDCTKNVGEGKQLQNVCGSIFVDVNGNKNPNVLGRDMFSFYITKYGIFPRGTAKQSDQNFSFEKDCAKPATQAGYGCAAWVLYNENMDYLHCDNLSWNGKKSCK